MSENELTHKSFISIPTGREIIKCISEGLIKRSTVRDLHINNIHMDSPLFVPYDLDDPICKSSDIIDLDHPYYDFCYCLFKDSHHSNYFLLFEDGKPKSIVYIDKYFGTKIISFEDIIIILSKKGQLVVINLSTLVPIFIGPLSGIETYKDWIWNLGEIKIDGEYQIFTSGEFKENSLFIRESSTGKTVEYFLDIREHKIEFESNPDRNFKFDMDEWNYLKEKKISKIFQDKI